MIDKSVVVTHKSKSNIITFKEEIDKLKVVIDSYYSLLDLLVYIIFNVVFIIIIGTVGVIMFMGFSYNASIIDILTISSFADLLFTLIAIWVWFLSFCLIVASIKAIPNFIKESFSRHHRQNVLEIDAQTFKLYWSHIRKYRNISNYNAQKYMTQIQRLMSDFNLDSNYIRYQKKYPIYLYKDNCIYKYDQKETAEQVKENIGNFQQIAIDSYVERLIKISSGSRGSSGTYVVERLQDLPVGRRRKSGNRKPIKESYKRIYKCFILTNDSKYELEQGLNYELTAEDRALIVNKVNNFLEKEGEN